MPSLYVNKTYSDPIPPTEDQLDDAFDSISTFFNVTGLGADNIADSSIGTDQLAPGSITSAKLALNSVGTTQLADSAVTVAKLAADIQGAFEPTGAISEWSGDAAPGGYLLCDGTPVSRSSYEALFLVVGTRFGIGDGTTTFNLPDLYGRMLRGRDGVAGRDPDSASRKAMNSGGLTGNNVGSIQEDDFFWAQGFVGGSNGGNLGNSTLSYSTAPNAFLLGRTTQDSQVGNAFGPGAPIPITNGSATPGNENRPKNAYVSYLIKT